MLLTLIIRQSIINKKTNQNYRQEVIEKMDLNIEQKKIAFSKPNGHALLKGVAGSGKTTVGIYRIPFLLNNYCYAKDDEILFCTYTKTLINYVSYIFDKIDASEREKMLFTSDEKKVSIKSIDKLMYEKYISYNPSFEEN